MALTSLVFLIGFFAGCVMAFARHPIYGLLTYVAVFYLHPPSRWWGVGLPDLRWSLLAAAVTAVALLLRGRKHKLSPDYPLMRHGIMAGLVAFLLWLTVQLLWVLDVELQMQLWVLYLKYVVLIAIIYQCIDSDEHLRLFLWTHVAGCFYLGWIAYTSYTGGRFEGFGGPGINEANAAGLQIVTGALSAGTLFLTESWMGRIALVAMMPLVLNGLITTISRSGFLAIVMSGFFFNVFTPRSYKKIVLLLSGLAAILFVSLTNPTYWARIASLKIAGQEVQGVDTGANRLILIDAQWHMFEQHPMGCGHRCTAILSPMYLEERYLSGGGRSSHNTFMSMTVEHGIPGSILYVLMILWIAKRIVALRRSFRSQTGLSAMTFTTVAATLIAIFVGDMFVDYIKSETRIWFIALLLVLSRMAWERQAAAIRGQAEIATAELALGPRTTGRALATGGPGPRPHRIGS